jgi:pimeloyl-ACP methyl ester carboxylesterase
MKRQRLGSKAKPVLEGLEARTLLSGGNLTAVGRGRSAPVQVSRGSVNEKAEASLHGMKASQQNAGSDDVSVSAALIQSVTGKSRGINPGDILPVRYEYPLLDRLAMYNAATGKFVQVTRGSIGRNNSATYANNVYVIAHGWMPGYSDWVKQLQNAYPKALPRSWQTWQGTGPKPKGGPSTRWLFQQSKTSFPGNMFTISDSGMAQQILSADPHATVLAYSWIDESATSSDEDAAGIPTQGYRSEAYTTMNGMRMAEAIMSALAPRYSQGLGKVHLIGHSHGARVATVAALALQQAGEQNSRFNVVRQLTLLDTPESTGTVTIGAANFDWFYLAQLQIAPPALQLTGTVVPGNPGQVTGLTNTSQLSVGMGVTGPGILPGTTIASIEPNQGVVLSTKVTVGSVSGVDLGFWTWGTDNIFVDNYDSWFGEPLNGYIVNDGVPTNHNELKNIVDVGLEPFSLFDPYPFSDYVASLHEYAAMWYAGSASTQGTPDQDGLGWSPLIEGASIAASQSLMQSNSGTAGTQFLLTTAPPSPESPNFSSFTLNPTQASRRLIRTRGQAPVSSVTLSNAPKSTYPSQFAGTFTAPNGDEGVSFDYSFSKANDGAQLQILVNGQLYFAITGSVAKASKILPNSGNFTATFDLGMNHGTVPIEIALVKPNTATRGSSGSTQVTVSRFQTFTG